MRITIIFILLSLTLIITAQDSQSSPQPITVDNIQALQSVHQLNFASDLTISDQLFEGQINFGWFVASPQANRFLLIDSVNTVLSVTRNGVITAQIEDTNLVDAVPIGNDYFALLFATADGFDRWYDNLNDENRLIFKYSSIGDQNPSAIWVNCFESIIGETISCESYVETFGEQATIFISPYISFPLLNNGEMERQQNEIPQLLYEPENDDSAVVRIGRISLPYVVTSSIDGLVQLWNLSQINIFENGLVYEVDNATGEPSVFGNINTDATHLVWRDNANENLYLLNFETGDNQDIAPLNGEYAQWYFLSDDASVIIAVNLGGEPNIVAWDTATGERTILGNYRDCERPQPDMVRFDGTTLIIGCDTGLDIWQINEGA